MFIQSLHFPLKAVLGVLDLETEFGELVANQVTGGPVLGSLGVAAHLQQQVNGLTVGLQIHAVAAGGIVADAQHVDQVGLEHALQLVDVGLAEAGMTVV